VADMAIAVLQRQVELVGPEEGARLMAALDESARPGQQ
jgi:hypothetical protein